jgi:3-deoxy-D-manno-octulosonic-acid transferase
MRYLINILYCIGLLLGSPYFIFKMITAGKYRRGLAQRFGRIPARTSNKPVIWVHAVSVGELQLAKPLVDGIRAQHPGHEVVITHTTKTGEEVAAKLYPDLMRFYSPLDFSWVVAKVMRALKPDLIILVELELWPNFLLEAGRRNIPVLIANGRISERSAAGYGRNAWFFRKPFAAITRAAVQNPEYGARLSRLLKLMKLDPSIVEVAGNIKYDNIAPGRDDALRVHYRALFGVANNEYLLVCGSTHPGEHEILVKLYRQWRDAGIRLRLVVVPRHPERWDAVRSLWKKAGIPLLDRSKLTEESPAPATSQSDSNTLPACILFDVMGELGKLYHAADLAFIGGSLIPHGGQNMIEPAAIGVPVLYGPHTKNFRATVADLAAANGGITVSDDVALFREVAALCNDDRRRADLGEAGRRVIQAGRGSVKNHLAIVGEMLRG